MERSLNGFDQSCFVNVENHISKKFFFAKHEITKIQQTENSNEPKNQKFILPKIQDNFGLLLFEVILYFYHN